jgi:transcription initiation factor TFIIIB Brf1 subunit/transcription initiation factor TFIIB
MSTSVKSQSKPKQTKTIPKGFRSHENARSKRPESKSFFTRGDSRSPPRQTAAITRNIGKNDDEKLQEPSISRNDEKDETSSYASSLRASVDNSPRSLSRSQDVDEKFDEKLDAGLLDEDDVTQVIDTSDLDFSRSEDLCSHSNVMEKEGLVICEDCGQELYSEGAPSLDFSGSSSACEHQNVVKEKGTLICEDCGEELYEEISHDQEWRKFGDFDGRGAPDPTRCQYRKAAEKGIRRELERMGFAPDICKLADEDYMLITKEEIKRSELRKGIIFACVLEAHKRVKRPITPDEVASKFFNLQRKTQSQGLQFYRLRCPRSYFQYEDISAKHFIPQIMQMPQFNTKSEHIERVIMLHERIADKCPMLNRSNPQSISKALIYYYFRRRGVLISPARFGKIVNLSHIILLRLSSAISRLLGTGKTVSLL